MLYDVKSFMWWIEIYSLELLIGTDRMLRSLRRTRMAIAHWLRTGLR